MLLIPAVLEKKWLLACSAASQPWDMQVAHLTASLLFQYFLKHFLGLNLALNPTGNLKTNKSASPSPFYPGEGVCTPFSALPSVRETEGQSASVGVLFPHLFLEDLGASRLCPGTLLLP